MKIYGLDKGVNRITDTMKGLHEDAKENSGSIDEMLSKFEKNQLRRQGGSNAESTQEPAPNNETNKKETGDTGTSGNNNTGNGNDGGNSNGENTGNAGNKPGGTGNTGIGGNTGSEGSGNTGDSGTGGYKCSNSISWGGATECEWFDLINKYLFDKYDPLVLDLNGDSKISTINRNDSNSYFNHDGDNIKYRTSWIGKEDGILVIDKNGNGTIDNGNELFGNFTTKNNGDMANNGFEALKDYDTNGDLIIDYRDDKFSELRVWQDLNSDGISQSNELKTLKEAGISRLNLNNSETSNEVLEGNSITHTGSFVRNDGTTSILAVMYPLM